MNKIDAIVAIALVLALVLVCLVLGLSCLPTAYAVQLSAAPLIMPAVRFKLRGNLYSLTQASKMLPVYSWSLPARLSCPAAAASIKRLGALAVCSACYAWQRGNYRFRGVQAAQLARLQLVRDCLRSDSQTAALAGALVQAIRKAASIPRQPHWRGLFRWHDSGDLFSAKYVRLVRTVAAATPAITHWIPTREYATADRRKLQALRQLAKLPNVVLRCSALAINGRTPKRQLPAGSCASYVADSWQAARQLQRQTGALVCPATAANYGKPASERQPASCHSCSCSACYTDQNIIYMLH